MKIAFAGIPILFVLMIILHANNAYAPCPGGPGFNCNNYPESNLSKNPQIVNLKVSPSNPKVGDTFTVTATLVNNSTVPIVVDGGKCSAQDTQAELFTILLDNHVKNKAENINCAGVGWSPLLDPGKNITGTSPDYTTNYVATESGTATITVTFSYHTIIKTDPIQTSDEQTISKSFQFQIHDINETYAQKPPAYFTSPLKQFKSGVGIWLITCKPGFYFVLKAYDREPLCLKTETISKLASRGFLFATSPSNDNHTTVIISPGSENQVSPHTYSPDVITVVLGVNNTVRWVNQADVANKIVPDMPLIQNGKSFGSNDFIKPDQSYTFTFTEPGTFPYHAEPHPWMKGTVIVLPQSNQIKNIKSNDPFGITALIIYHPPDLCLNPPSHSVPSSMPSCPPNKFYLKINSNSTAYLMGYNICDANSCATNNTLSIILPLNAGLNPDYQMIGLPVNLPWKYGDTVGIQLYVSPTNDNKTASLIDLGNSSIVP